eukprot:TRINITY_DN10115_c0_g3_i1.p1 TRINITY_DN10115_c0_g3~~TRINITY_DN10115_c0_g3_i1.p1  ORF type:complete len:372 (+),score=113.60 TRINITY_DN10115_c0_g3_i1:460-1575(+)
MQVHLQSGNYGSTLQAAEEVVSLAKRYGGQDYVEAEALHFAAKAQLQLQLDSVRQRKTFQNLPSEAVESATEAVEKFRGLGNETSLATSLETLAAAHLQSKSAEKAASASEEAASLWRHIGTSHQQQQQHQLHEQQQQHLYQQNEARALLQLATAYLELGSIKKSEAEAAAATAHDLLSQLSEPSSRALRSLALDLQHHAQHYDDEFRSGLWAPQADTAGKLASGINSSVTAVAAKRRNNEGSDQKKFGGGSTLFDRKAFPWRPEQQRDEQEDGFAYAPQMHAARLGSMPVGQEDAVAGGAKGKGKGKGGGKGSAIRPASSYSRDELRKLTLIELYKYARAAGADFKRLSVAMDGDNPRDGLLAALLESAR